MITTESIQSVIIRLNQVMEQSADELNTADGLLGDGDLGVTMIRGFRNLLEELESLPTDIGMAFFQCAKAFTKTSGSSYGTLLATGMMAVAKAKKGHTKDIIENNTTKNSITEVKENIIKNEIKNKKAVPKKDKEPNLEEI